MYKGFTLVKSCSKLVNFTVRPEYKRRQYHSQNEVRILNVNAQIWTNKAHFAQHRGKARHRQLDGRKDGEIRGGTEHQGDGLWRDIHALPAFVHTHGSPLPFLH